MSKVILDIETEGLDPLRHQIIAIGILDIESNEITIIDCLNEERGLRAFWEYVSDKNVHKIYGFNIDFDWTFLKLRSLKYRIKIKHFKKFEGRIDLRMILNSQKYAKGKLKDYAEFLGYECNDDCEGHTVPELYKLYLEGYEEALNAIFKHLKRDLERTKYIYDVLLKSGLIEG